MSAESFASRLPALFDFAGQQLRRLVGEQPGYFPLYTLHGRWRHGGESWTNWCEGFLGGQLWLMYACTHDPWWRGQAETYSRLIAGRRIRPQRTRPGLPLLLDLAAWHELTGDPAARDVVRCGRAHPQPAFPRTRPLSALLRRRREPVIDIMMNVGIIFYARSNRRRGLAAHRH